MRSSPSTSASTELDTLELSEPRSQNPRMAPRPGRPPSAAERRFFLAVTPPARPELLPGDAEHARVVLRMVAGDRCVGLDGRGRSWPLRVTLADRKRIEVEASGDPTLENEPGEPGAALAWIEVAFAPPRGSRAEDLLDALVQLGAAALTPLVTERSTPFARGEGEGRRDRWERAAREACKQSGRTWMPEMSPALEFDAFLERLQASRAALVRLDPRAEATAGDVLDSILPRTSRPSHDESGGDGSRAGTRARPIVLAIGPEGGFSESEERRLDECGARAMRLAPHVLRIETAAQAALAVVVAHALRR